MIGRATGRVIGPFRSRPFVLFLVTGGSAAAVDFGSRIGDDRAMGFSAAVVLACLADNVTAFDVFVRGIAHAVGVIAPVYASDLGHKRWTFGARNPFWPHRGWASPGDKLKSGTARSCADIFKVQR